MLVQNWPTAFVMICFMVMIMVIVTALVNKEKPLARNCSRCQKDIEREENLRNGITEPDE